MSGKKRAGYVGASCVCPHCKTGDARFVSHRQKGFVSLLGPIRIAHSYYHCGRCGEGHFPWDRTLHLFSRERLTPAAAEVTTMHGVQTAFAEASERSLYKSAGLRLSESTVERVTESAGEQLAKMLKDNVRFSKDEVWEWERDASGRTCAYVSLDATGVRQQGLRGAKVDGRMAYTAMIYNPRGAARTRERRKATTPQQVRYLAGFYDLDELGLQLRRQAAQVGWDLAEQQIALSDGGSGLEEFFTRNFPLAAIIIDFWHVKEYLVELGKAFFGEAPDGKQWVSERCHQLKAEGGAAVLATLEALEVAGRSESQRELHRVTTNYFRNHQHKMDYPRYVAQGWQIGSGPVESACKTVVGKRLCGSGMRWGSPGSHHVCHLRALFLSQPSQWENFWQAYPN